MSGNRDTLDWLLETEGIALVRTPLLDQAPPPLGERLDFGRVRGMMLGLAIGDALGNTSEGLSPAQRRAAYGEVRSYLANPLVGVRGRGVPSDDTQLAFWTLEQLLADGALVPENLAWRFSSGRIFGLGHTVAAFLAAYRSGRPWYACGPRSAGNGALMRIAPVLIPHLRAPSAALWADTALAAMMTHNDAGSTAACIAFVSMLRELVARDAAPAAPWWPETYVGVAGALEGETAYEASAGRAYRGPIWRFVESELPRTYARGTPTVEACEGWGSSAYLLETVPSALYILMRHATDPEEAVVRAVNDTRDNDTIGAVVGAAVGALHGEAALPRRWRRGLLGRTAEADDGRVFELLHQAETAFG